MAIPNMATAMRIAETTSAARRPTLSPKCPKTIAPSGRKKKPAAPTPKVSSREFSCPGKYTRARLTDT